MTRTWDELVATLFDAVPPQVVLLVLIFGSMLVSALWYWYPAWVPRRLPRRRRAARTRRAAKKVTAEEIVTAAEPEPDPPPVDEVPLGLADRLAAEGRYAEAIRQRLRDTVRDLVAAGVMAPQPGWTVAELAAVAAVQHPATAEPFADATDLFTAVWYAARPASREQDDRMRALTDEVRGRAVRR